MGKDRAKYVRGVVENKAKVTVGYAEAKNKKNFMSGVFVGIHILEGIYEQEITDLKWALDHAKKSADTHKEKLNTISSILKEYS